jgi:hypothetical protein
LRESLTVLTGVLILILSAALVVPYFIDWSAQRGLVETQLADVLGRPVKIRGGIDLKLLPTPYLRLANVEIGTQAARPDIKVAEVQLEIALPSLLHGEVDFTEAKLVRPQLALAIENGTLPLGPPLQHFSGPMRFERISVEDGALDLADPSVGRNYKFQNISFAAEAVSLAGPFKADGTFSFAGRPSPFRLATGDENDGRLHFKLILDETAQHPRADLDADLIFAKQAEGLPALNGQMKLSGHLGGALALPWQIAGTLDGALRKAALKDLELRFGDEDHAVSFTGGATFDFGRMPQAHATLKAREIDLDRLLNKPGTSAMQRLAQSFGAVVTSNDVLLAGMPVAIDAAVESALLGGENLNAVSGSFAISAQRALAVRFEASGPERSQLRFAGNVETGDAAGFKGHIDARVGDVARFGPWLRTQIPQSAPLIAALPVRSFDISGEANISAIGFVGQNLSLRLDQSMLSGTLAYTQAVGGEPARLFADLVAPRLDLDSVPDVADAFERAKAMDLSLRLDAHAVKIGSLAEAGLWQGLGPGLGQGGLDTGRIQLKLEKTGKIAKLDDLSVTALGGADIHAHGQWDGATGDFAGSMDSARLEALAALLHRLAPGQMSDLFVKRAGDLAPAHLTLSAHAVAGPNGGVSVKSFDFAGTVGGTAIAAKIGNDPQNPADLSLTANLHAPDALALFRQLGLPALPLQGLGEGQLEIAAKGSPGKAFATSLTATLAGAKIGFAGTLQGDLAAPHAAGRLQLTSPGLTELLEATGLAFPDPALRLAADLKADVDARPSMIALSHLSGRFADTAIAGSLNYDVAQNHITGALDTDRLAFASLAETVFGAMAPPPPGANWSNGKFGPAMLDPPPVDLALTAKSFDLWPQISGRDARFGLAISGNRAGLKFSLQHLAMQLGDGTLAAELTLRRDGTSAAASGHLKLVDYGLVLPSLRGRLAADLDLAGSGDSPAAIISSLAGSGTVDVADLVLPRTDPGGMARVFQAVEDDSLALDADEINRAIASELGKGASHLGMARFDAGIAAGVLRLTPKGAAMRVDPGVVLTVQANLDLTHLSLDQRSSLTLLALPQNWRGPPPQINLISTGPLGNPAQTIDSGLFLNALAARAIARESARIQAQEFDIHEQAFFYNRLKSERRREAERLKAAEDARRMQAAAEAAAKDAAAKEAAAKAEAAKEAAAKAEPAKVEPAKSDTVAPASTNSISTHPSPTKAETAPRQEEKAKSANAKAESAKAESTKVEIQAPEPPKAADDKPNADAPATFAGPVPLPKARPVFHAARKPPLPIVRQPAQPAPAPFFRTPSIADPLAAGPY